MTTRELTIVILVFDKFTALDIVGPYEVLSRLPGASIKFVALERGAYNDAHGLKLIAEYHLEEISSADILLIPGGHGVDAVLKNDILLTWIQMIDKTSSWTVSVCSGALLLAEAGILTGTRCTTHHRRKDQLNQYDVDVVHDRFVHSGKVITSAGVSAGIDMAFYLVEQIAGADAALQIRIGIEY